MEIKKYKRDSDYSYTLGAFPTFELIDARPESVLAILVTHDFSDRKRLEEKCEEAYASGKTGHRIEIIENDKLIDRLSDKENVYAVGLFSKFDMKLSADRPHVVLVNPSNMGNLGTIIRTACGFGIEDIAIIGNSADMFNPKVVRASMGAIFRVRIQCFEDYGEYSAAFCGGDSSCNRLCDAAAGPQREIFTFMLNGRKQLKLAESPKAELYSLIFGNEATGLPDEYLDYGTSVIIPQTEFVDSLNLTIAAGIGMYVFTQNRF